MNRLLLPFLFILGPVALGSPLDSPGTPPPQTSRPDAQPAATSAGASMPSAPTILSEFAGLKVGAQLDKEWKVESATSDSQGVRFGLQDKAGRTLHLVASPISGLRSPFDLEHVGIHYERTELSPDAMAVPARALTKALLAGAGSEAALEKLVSAEIARASSAKPGTAKTGPSGSATGNPASRAESTIDLSSFAGRWKVSSKTEGSAGENQSGRCERILVPDSSLLEEDCRFTVDGREQHLLGTWGIDLDGKVWLFWAESGGGFECLGSSVPGTPTEPMQLQLSCLNGSAIAVRIVRSPSKPNEVVREWSLSRKEDRKKIVTVESRE